jgi:hypothetical protein
MPSLKLIRLILAAAVCGSLILVLVLTFKPNTINVLAKTQQDERKLENEIPKHVPLRIKIRKEKEFKDTKSENWAHDFELEVTNTGEKPIYEFYLDLILDVKDSTGQNVSAPVYYGRAELGDHRVKATERDLPLKPGESCVLKIHPGQLGAWDIIRRKESRPHPRTIRIKFVTLSFGDGTGLMGPDATPVPRKVAERSGLARCAPQNSRNGMCTWSQRHEQSLS